MSREEEFYFDNVNAKSNPDYFYILKRQRFGLMYNTGKLRKYFFKDYT